MVANAWRATSDGHCCDRHTPLARQAFATCRDEPDRRGTWTAENGTPTAHAAADTRKNHGLSPNRLFDDLDFKQIWPVLPGGINFFRVGILRDAIEHLVLVFTLISRKQIAQVDPA